MLFELQRRVSLRLAYAVVPVFVVTYSLPSEGDVLFYGAMERGSISQERASPLHPLSDGACHPCPCGVPRFTFATFLSRSTLDMQQRSRAVSRGGGLPEPNFGPVRSGNPWLEGQLFPPLIERLGILATYDQSCERVCGVCTCVLSSLWAPLYLLQLLRLLLLLPY